MQKRTACQKTGERKKYRENIKNDPSAYAKAKQKEHERYLKRKEQKKIQSISELSAREQRQKRKKWRVATNKYRLKHKQNNSNKPTINQTIFEDNDDLPSGSSHRPSSVSDPIFSATTGSFETPVNASRRIYGRKRIRRDRSSMYRKIIKLQDDLKKERSKSEKFKKRYYMLLNANQSSPKKSVQKIIHKTKVSPVIKKNYLRGKFCKAN
ncbi:unnamed protein product [Larinioides sclopetarius]|uniref:Uncharacterized protein n=1 Tax=Larinioides sclopetarius TaxID=280406 RepID=A0AAV1ZGD4_9ARAC